MPLTAEQKKFIDAHRIGHLATADSRGRPHVIPICYVCDDSCLYSVLDAKPKRVAVKNLKRVLNIQENPRVAVVVDEYDEDWTRLAYVLLHGTAQVLTGGEEHARALRLLREKYPQYRAMQLEGCPVICMAVQRVISWAYRGS
jgi:PPOX class probable F420-dependent enzyme